VGRYRIDLELLVSEKFAKKSNRGVLLRFQRTDEFMRLIAKVLHWSSDESRSRIAPAQVDSESSPYQSGDA
jgi:hypothetical protein